MNKIDKRINYLNSLNLAIKIEINSNYRMSTQRFNDLLDRRIIVNVEMKKLSLIKIRNKKINKILKNETSLEM